MVDADAERSAAALVRHLLAQDAGSAQMMMAEALGDPPTPERMHLLLRGAVQYAGRVVGDLAEAHGVDQLAIVDGHIRYLAEGHH